MIAIALLTLAVGIASPQVAEDGWAGVTQLPAGVRLTVDSTSELRVTGTLASADETGLTLNVEGRQVRVGRVDVLRVRRHQPRHVGRAARRGFLVGAAFGAGLGAVTAKSDRALWISLMTVGWSALAAGASAMIALGPPRTEVVYAAAEAMPPPSAPPR